MRRKISSKMTGFHKFAVPVLLVTVAIINIAILATRTPGVSIWAVVFVALISALICVPLIWFAGRLKHLSLDEQFLYIERGSPGDKIPIGHIAEVKQANWIKPFPVTVSIINDHGHRRKISFIPQRQTLKSSRRHPIVAELNHLRSERNL